MCGFAGILHFGNVGDAASRVDAMAASIVHRGPDDNGVWSDEDVALGFRRLSIIDVKLGAQPMSNQDQTVWVVFNGEIYNHRALRQQLEALGHRFSTDHSDTEVLVHGWVEWGEDLPKHLNGMFAFAVWDRKQRSLFLARDRLGIKPLYLASGNGTVLFGSEARTLHHSGLLARAANAQGVLEYFQQQNLWGGRSMYAGVELMTPGTFLRVDPIGSRKGSFWDVNFDRKQKKIGPAADKLRHVLEGTIERQLAADVPVMTYLSGGIDSSAITSRAHQLDPKVRSYTCIFDLDGVADDKIVDEREFSRAIAEDLGHEHIELELPQDDLVSSLMPTVSSLEEPRMGMAYVNYRIAERVAQDSKVVLSGCGGDEILGGYVARYSYLQDGLSARRKTGKLAWLSEWFAAPQKRLSDTGDLLSVLYGFPVRPVEVDEAFTPSFLRSAGDYRMTDSLMPLLAECPSKDPWDLLMYVDAKTYLQGLLMVEDKLSMAHSLEARVPLLDNDVVDFALSCDWRILTDGVTGKMVFREAIRDWVPEIVADKPKMGFGPPDASWYRGRLRPFVERLLSPSRIKAREVFQPAFVARALDEHMSGAANRLPFIWSLLSFEAWCELNDFYGGDLGEPIAR